VGDPVGEGEPPAGAQQPERLGQNIGLVRDVQERLLAQHDVGRCIRQRAGGDVALDDADLIVEPDQCRQALGTGDTGRRELDSRHAHAVAMGEVARWSAEPGAEIDDLETRLERARAASASFAASPP
jgi:hypothetical protein